MTPVDLLILIGICLILILLIVEMVMRIQEDKHLDRMIRLVHQRVVGHNRDLNQHRFHIATLRRYAQANGADFDALSAQATSKSDDAIMQAAVDQLNEVEQGTNDKNNVADDGIKVDNLNITETTKTLKDKEILELVQAAVNQERIGITLQPIVSLPDEQTVHYEAFARISMDNNEYISAGRFISLAANNNMVPIIDNVILLRCLQLIRQAPDGHMGTSYFCNISAQTLNNRKFVRNLTDFLEVNPRLSSQLVFEFSQEDTMKLSSAARSVIEGLSMLGCRFSMDNVTAFGFDIGRLSALNIAFVKLDASKILTTEKDTKSRLKRIKYQLEAVGIEVILEKLETPRQLNQLNDLYPNYGQGYLFGAPK